jgi:hypothetical protein
MNLKEFLIKVAPVYCGVPLSNGKTSELVYNAEIADEKAYAAESFESTRDRAKAYVPYCNDESNDAQTDVVNIVELAICSHRQAEHGEDHSKKIEELDFLLVSAEPDFLLEYSTEDAKAPGWNG